MIVRSVTRGAGFEAFPDSLNAGREALDRLAFHVMGNYVIEEDLPVAVIAVPDIGMQHPDHRHAKLDGEPGVKTLWIGMQRVQTFAACLRFGREQGQAGSYV